MSPLKSAFRSLVRTPLVSIVAVLSLALGMGANAAIVSIYERVLLRALPVPNPDELVNLVSPGPKRGSSSSGTPGGSEAVWSYPAFRDFEGTAGLPFAGLAAEVGFGANLGWQGSTQSGFGALVSGSYFPTLGLQPALGRLLTPDDDRKPGGHPLVVLDHAYWQSAFGGARDVIGKPLLVNGQPLTIVGVLPREWTGRTAGARPQLYVPLTHHAKLVAGRDTFTERRTYWLYVFGRLQPGVTRAKAEAAINVPYRTMLRDVEMPLNTNASETFRREFLAKRIALEPAAGGQTTIDDEVRAPLRLLLAVTALVLLIAAANIANLLLVRAVARAGEMSVRLSLGARRSQLIGLLLTESFVLAAGGAALGLLVAGLTLRLFRALLPADSDVAALLVLDAKSFAFLALLVPVVGIAGLFPALHSTRRDLVSSLRGQGRITGSRAAQRFRSGMATLQIALSLTLMVAAGLFVRSLANVSRVNLGMRLEQVATFGLSPERNGLQPDDSKQLFARLEEELARVPGVTAVGTSRVPVLGGDNWTNNVTVEGYEAGPDENVDASFSQVGPGFFATLGIPLLAGRDLTLGDDIKAPKVAVVNQAFVDRFELGREAVGKRMAMGSGPELDIVIVGVVGNAAYSQVKSEPVPVYYQPWRQSDSIGDINFYVRSARDPEALLPAVRSAVRRVAPDLPLQDLATMQVRVRDNVFLDRLLSALSAGFALLATLLAAIGLYGVLAYAVAQRTHEIGIRLALGAARPQVRRLVLAQVLRIAGGGAVLGLVAGFVIGRLASSVLYRLDGSDPAAFAGALAVLAATSFAAGLVPAMRAQRIEPMVALRSE